MKRTVTLTVALLALASIVPMGTTLYMPARSLSDLNVTIDFS